VLYIELLSAIIRLHIAVLDCTAELGNQPLWQMNGYVYVPGKYKPVLGLPAAVIFDTLQSAKTRVNLVRPLTYVLNVEERTFTRTEVAQWEGSSGITVEESRYGTFKVNVILQHRHIQRRGIVSLGDVLNVGPGLRQMGMEQGFWLLDQTAKLDDVDRRMVIQVIGRSNLEYCYRESGLDFLRTSKAAHCEWKSILFHVSITYVICYV
jgi:hypothetical protein